MSNEITAYFKGRTGVAESVYQYDYGMVMVIDGLDFTNNFDCYFSTAGEDEAIPAIGSDNRVVIPNDCLTRAGDVTLHIPSHAGENDSEVEYVVTFKVIGRARPVDDGTAEEQSAISKAIALLNHTTSDVVERINAYLDENAAEPIQDWLDDHPEATTTVQDNSITMAKLSDGLQAKIDSISSDMKAAPFEHINNQDLLNCIYSWFDARNDLSYGNDSTTEHVAVDEDGYKEIDCSLFAWYVCMGIKYSDSIYGGGSNTPSYNYSYLWDGILDMAQEMGFDRVLANVQAKYCKEHGYLFEPHDDLSDLQYGDLLFYDNAIMPSYWENIGHVAVYLYTTTYGDVVVAEAREGNDGHAIFINNSFDTSRINYAARLPIYSLETIQQKNLIKNSIEIVKEFNTTLTSSYVLATCELSEPSVEGRLYTAVVKLSDALPNGYYVAVQLIGASALSARVLYDNENHTFQLPFKASISGATEMNVMLYAPTPSSQQLLNKLEFAGLYYGIHNLIVPTASTADVYDLLLAPSSVGTWTVGSNWKYRKYGRIVEVVLSGVLLTSSYTTVFSLPTGFRPSDSFYEIGVNGVGSGFPIFVSSSGNVQVCQAVGVAQGSGNAHFVFLT